MKSSVLRPFRRVLLCLTLIPSALPAFAQKPPQSREINLDKELEGQVAPDRAASYYHYSLAKWSEYRGDLLKALSEMESALKYNPSSPTVHMELASLLERTGSSREAIEHAEEAARLDPQDPDPHWLLANIYFKPQERGSSDTLKKAVAELEILRGLTPEDERIYYALGGAYFEIDEPDKAIEAFEHFQSLSADADNGYREIAKYYERKGEDAKAVEYWSKALKVQPDSTESLVRLGALYAKMNRSKEAVPIYKKLLETNGSNPKVVQQLASTLIEAGEYADAYKALAEIAKADPEDKEVQILIGRAQTGMHDYPAAIKTLAAVVASDPQSPEAQFYLAVAYEQSGDNSEAAKIYSALLEATPEGGDEAKSNRMVFAQRLAGVYEEMGENQKAIEIYQDMVKADPKTSPQLVNAYRVGRQFDKALALGKQLYDKDPADIHTAIVYARTLADAGKAKAGAEILSKLLQANPKNIDIRVNLSQVYLQDKKYSDAEKVLRRSEDRDSDSQMDRERLRFQLATVYEKQKDFDRAESLLKEILKDNPKNAVALNYIGYMLADRGVRLQEAVQYVKEALDIDPHNGAYLDSLGWAFFKLNDLASAEKYLLEAGGIVRNDPTIDDHLGDLYYKTGNFEKAQEFWTNSVKIGTEQEEIQKVRRKLEMLQDTLRRQKH